MCSDLGTGNATDCYKNICQAYNATNSGKNISVIGIFSNYYEILLQNECYMVSVYLFSPLKIIQNIIYNGILYYCLYLLGYNY